jgi:hypothetical protein
MTTAGRIQRLVLIETLLSLIRGKSNYREVGLGEYCKEKNVNLIHKAAQRGALRIDDAFVILHVALWTIFANYFNALSIACVTFSPSGFSFVSKRAIIFPLRSTRNLLKFQLMSPPNSGLVSLLVRNL